MEEQAQHHPDKINKAEFLSAIQGPFEKAFTPENIKKGFEKPGIWPIDCNQIMAEMMGPSEGILYQARVHPSSTSIAQLRTQFNYWMLLWLPPPNPRSQEPHLIAHHLPLKMQV